MLKRKLLALSVFVAVISFAFLTSCSDSASKDQSSNKENGKTKISITWRGTGESDNIRRYLEEFEKKYESENPNIDIVLSPIIASEGDYFSKIALALKSPSTAPNIVSEDTFMLSADANAGYLKKLDEYINSWKEWDMFVENLKEGVMGEDGSIYAVPTTTDSRGIWYNKEVFKQAGLPTDWQPKTWQDILDAAQQIKKSVPGVIPFAMNVAKANGEATSMQTFEMLLYSTGETLYDTKTKKWNVSGKGILDSLTFIDEIMNKQKLGPSLSIALSTNYGSVMMQDLLPKGKVGMVLDGSWNIGQYVEGGAVPLDNPEEVLGFALFPTQNGEDPGFITMSGGWAWAIPTNSKNHDLSWKVIEAMSTEEWQSKRANYEGTLTVRKDSAENPEYASRPFIEVATKALENAYFRPKSDLYPKVSIEIQNAVEAVASGSLTPKEAAEQFKKAVTDLVGKNNVN